MTDDRRPSAPFEHPVFITREGVEIPTRAREPREARNDGLLCDVARRCTLLLLVLGWGCTVRPGPIIDPNATGEDVLLARQRVVEVVLPPAGGQENPRRYPVTLKATGKPGHFRLQEPVHLPFYRMNTPRHQPPFELYAGKRKLDFHKKGPWSWSRNQDHIDVVLPVGTGPKLQLDSRQLRSAIDADDPTKARDPAAFVFRDRMVTSTVEHGAYLPAPASVRVEATVPPGAPRFRARVSVACPPIGACSDGARLQVRLKSAGSEHVLWNDVVTEEPVDLDLDLAAWAKHKVEIELASSTEGDPAHDAVFVAEPALIDLDTPPRRALIVLVDTLRQDHLGVYGHSRDTSPNLDSWAATGMVFEAAHSPAPWTLPSSRALLSARQPERWKGELVTAALARSGFTTLSLSANRYVAVGYGLTDDFSVHEPYHPQSAATAAQRLATLMKRFSDRDVFALVHIMDPHFPYTESKQFRGRFAGERPAWIGPGEGSDTYQAAWDANPDRARREQLVEYVRARYDQNILQVDTSLPHLQQIMGEDALVAFTSDHGEAFFERDKLGHGRDLTHESTRIPLIIAGPGIEAGRNNQLVTLTDLIPTLAELLDVQLGEHDGRSLVAAVRGQRIDEIPIGMGRNLFGPAAWAVMHGDQRFEVVGFDTTLGPRNETTPTTQATTEQLETWRPRLEQGIGLPVRPVWRFAVESDAGTSIARARETTVEIRRKGGLPMTWPRSMSNGAYAKGHVLSDGVRFGPGGYVPNEIFVLADDDIAGTVVTYEVAGEKAQARPIQRAERPWATLEVADAPLRVGPALQPIPEHLDAPVEDDEHVKKQLEALGYAE